MGFIRWVRRQINRRIPLLFAVLAAIATGLALTALTFPAVRRVAGPSSGNLDVLRVVFTAVAGVGGIVALVIAYRRQNDLEQGRFVERFGAAAAQLGNPDPAVRIAGVYAMAGVADENPKFSRRQQCIDVLCGYLRLPYEPDHGSSHHTELVTTTRRRPPTIARPPHESEETQRRLIRQNDREVRTTIVRVIAARLQSGAESCWSKSNFDFNNVFFENPNFGNTEFRGRYVSFIGAQFADKMVSFDGAKFACNETVFDHAKFTCVSTNFGGAIFDQEASFYRATFAGERTWFHSVEAKSSINFNAATFSSNDETSFAYATFRDQVGFTKTTFASRFTSFTGVAFMGESAQFISANFTGRHVSFNTPRVWQKVLLPWDMSASPHRQNETPMPECIEPKDWPPKPEPENP